MIGPLGVVGDSGCEVIPVWRAGSIEGNRSASRTGLNPIPSPASIEGTAAGRDCIGVCLLPPLNDP